MGERKWKRKYVSGWTKGPEPPKKKQEKNKKKKLEKLKKK